MYLFDAFDTLSILAGLRTSARPRTNNSEAMICSSNSPLVRCFRCRCISSPHPPRYGSCPCQPLRTIHRCLPFFSTSQRNAASRLSDCHRSSVCLHHPSLSRLSLIAENRTTNSRHLFIAIAFFGDIRAVPTGWNRVIELFLIS